MSDLTFLDEKDIVVIDGDEYQIKIVEKFVEMMSRVDATIDVEWLVRGPDGGDDPKWFWTVMVSHLGTFHAGYWVGLHHVYEKWFASEALQRALEDS